ncbi:hypothetical protein C9413_20930 [Rhizobium sp. SEMIA 4085]|uniref:Uncharacterized protein n=1 Tax=Rhizobium gallicum bv. gallicum R602sp TaxID=1041138 RepID=A0A0B4X3W9_9HYPH|nr:MULTISPECIES: hypothetical protein [Rhizobium]AJD41193.1 hypothetical protein RGR602_CH01862 [Rhizobium gallicum bv. gallicum R602sp]NNH31850.1 hypothetical protein [Rhizobium sp. SEMIA 4085]
MQAGYLLLSNASPRAPQAKAGMQEHIAQLLRAIEGVANRIDGLTSGLKGRLSG